ncbi:MAG: hypothetical protein FWB78_11950 [Treponema sp.]|nr:hypothetical protein [Treponema sp.]
MSASDKGSWLGRDEKYHPKSRIFLSADIIDSVTKKGRSSDEWAQGFANFLSNFQTLYRGAFNDAIDGRSPCGRRDCESPCTLEERKAGNGTGVDVWKYMGDEIVLMAELSCLNHDASLYVLALAEAIRKFNKDESSLRVKGTAWVAGFPVRNIELHLPKNMHRNNNNPDSLGSEESKNEKKTESEGVKDFLGPSIDLGFRLSEEASEDQLIVSPSLAYLIASAVIERGGPSLDLYFGGMKRIKGFKNKQPLFWYALGDKLGAPVPPEELKNFYERRADGSSPFPFIPPPNNAAYNVKFNKTVRAHKDVDYSVHRDFEPATGGTGTSEPKKENPWVRPKITAKEFKESRQGIS